MKLSANKAAVEAGIAKKTLLEAIKSSRLSASKNEKGHWEIDTAELFRVFPKTGAKPVMETETHPPEKPHETIALEMELQLLRERLVHRDSTIENLQTERDDWKKQAQTLALTDQRQGDGASKSTESRKLSFTERWTGRVSA